MTSTLMLMRHGKAAAEAESGDDKDRPLTPRGQHQSEVTGAWLKAQGFIPTHILCSAALRTRETLAWLMQGLGEHADIRFEEKLYHASAGDMLRLINQAPDDARRLLVIGHNPGMHLAAQMLCGSAEPDASYAQLKANYPTAALAVYDTKGVELADIKPSTLHLLHFVTPETLTAGS